MSPLAAEGRSIEREINKEHCAAVAMAALRAKLPPPRMGTHGRVDDECPGREGAAHSSGNFRRYKLRRALTPTPARLPSQTQLSSASELLLSTQPPTHALIPASPWLLPFSLPPPARTVSPFTVSALQSPPAAVSPVASCSSG